MTPEPVGPPDAGADASDTNANDASADVSDASDDASASAGVVELCAYMEHKNTVTDCNGGTVRAPYWLSKVDFGNALCVHAPHNAMVKVDFGTSLLGEEEATETNHQVYYSLSHLDVLPSKRHVVWAVCGGEGARLRPGTSVIPSVRLPLVKAEQLAARVAQLAAYEEDFDKAAEALCDAARRHGKTDYLEGNVHALKEAIDIEAGLLREALLTENVTGLQSKGMPRSVEWE